MQVLRNFFYWIATTTVTLCLVAVTGDRATAGVFYNGWNYAIDSFDDGVTGNSVGGGVFEFYGMAIKEDADKIIIALNANLPLSGFADANAEGGSITWGDLFFNFSGQDFNTASSNGNLFGIRFAAENDSGVPYLGVYSDVTAKNVTEINPGFFNLTHYNNYVESEGSTPGMGDLAATDPYFEQNGRWTILNEIETGNKVGDIEFQSELALHQFGVDFSNFNANGNYTIGFSFDRALFPVGDYTAHIFAECANDGIAIQGERRKVPEPSSLMGLLLLAGLAGVSGKFRRRSKSFDLGYSSDCSRSYR
ncbi:XDD3 family exosortase-dependent surface protein [Oscillatoria sp. HE19RPO]|uniref:XDD3 family exosortase-dependent surface protein n=1 Tax=Oscillatoria sp. HE19RPO TaxID=2954806 RepID=UPI0020C4DB26|nr:XDD3 family exosortase-dependent surface protein [Oscillatoria sp. HE19RPO]